VPVKPGKRYLLVLRARWSGPAGPGTTGKMVTCFNDAAGRMVENSLATNSFRCGTGWQAAVVETPIASSSAVTMMARADVMGQPDGHKAYFDDLKVYEIDD
jgi:hypothetical protein